MGLNIINKFNVNMSNFFYLNCDYEMYMVNIFGRILKPN